PARQSRITTPLCCAHGIGLCGLRRPTVAAFTSKRAPQATGNLATFWGVSSLPGAPTQPLCCSGLRDRPTGNLATLLAKSGQVARPAQLQGRGHDFFNLTGTDYRAPPRAS